MLQPHRSRQLVEQCLGLFQIGRIGPLGEPALDGGKEFACLGGLALGVPELGEAGGGAEFEWPDALISCFRDCPIQLGLGVL